MERFEEKNSNIFSSTDGKEMGGNQSRTDGEITHKTDKKSSVKRPPKPPKGGGLRLFRPSGGGVVFFIHLFPGFAWGG